MPKHTTRDPAMRAFHVAEREARKRYEQSYEPTDYFGETCDRARQYEYEFNGGNPPKD